VCGSTDLHIAEILAGFFFFNVCVGVCVCVHVCVCVCVCPLDAVICCVLGKSKVAIIRLCDHTAEIYSGAVGRFVFPSHFSAVYAGHVTRDHFGRVCTDANDRGAGGREGGREGGRKSSKENGARARVRLARGEHRAMSPVSVSLPPFPDRSAVTAVHPGEGAPRPD